MTAGDVISFGPYCLIPAERLLLRSGEAVDVGSRALDVLIALVESAGEIVGRRELMLRAWPNMVVGDGSLRVAIGGLRKALCDGQDGMRYIANVAGRGYCFVAHVDRSIMSGGESAKLPRARNLFGDVTTRPSPLPETYSRSSPKIDSACWSRRALPLWPYD
jgi:DNA-binding winged helix-turn-helix (wHTH) protein